jgi:hypothetical protein
MHDSENSLNLPMILVSKLADYNVHKLATQHIPSEMAKYSILKLVNECFIFVYSMVE